MASLAIQRKTSVGVTATTSHEQAATVFEQVHREMEERSNVLPLKNYLGSSPGKEDDKFDRRIVPQLSDISFEEDSEDDFEDAKNIKR